MGIDTWIGGCCRQVHKTTMNRFIALSTLLAVAAAAPEADPQILIPALVSPHAKTDDLITHPNGAKVPSDTVSVQHARAAHLLSKPWGVYGYPVHHLGKREAEAEPWYGLGYGYGVLAPKPVITSVGALTTYSNGAVTPTNTPAVAAATAQHLATKFGYGGHLLGKREAEAEPYYGLGYGYGYHPAITSVGGLTTYANGAVVPTDPANLAATSAHLASKGLVHLGKREAESDPYYGYFPSYPGVTSVGAQTTYTNGAVVPTDLNNLHATAAHLATTYPRPVGYGVHVLGKREAESEPFYGYFPSYPGVTSVGAQTTYTNGAVVPTHPANLHATAAHLATTYPRPAGYGVLLG